MKLQIDIDNKTIKIEEKVNLGKFFTQLEELFPDLKWREYDLETGIIYEWTNPWTYPTYPTPPWITYCTKYDAAGDPVVETKTNGGIYNIDIT